MTDWNAQHSTVQAANMGLDMTMPGSDFNGGTILWGPELTKAVNNGQVAQTRVDDSKHESSPSMIPVSCVLKSPGMRYLTSGGPVQEINTH